MICRNCLRTAARSQLLPPRIPQTPRFLSTTSFLRESNPVAASTTPPPPPSAAPPSPQAHPPPEPNSSTTAQALGAALPPQIAQKAKSLGLKGKDGSGKAHLVKSSIPAGTPLKGLNFLKNQQDPVAMADEEYPDWLWTVLEKQEMKGEAAAAGDLFCMSISTPQLYTPLFHSSNCPPQPLPLHLLFILQSC